MPELPTYCRHYGFDEEGISRRLRLLQLEEDDLPCYDRYREIIAPAVEDVATDFYAHMMRDEQFRAILDQGGYNIDNLRQTQKDYILTLGMDFDTPAYFESRLRIGLVHARVGVPLILYQCAYRLLMQLIIERIDAAIDDAHWRRILRRWVLKVTMLDMSLASETYLQSRLESLEHSLDDMRRISRRLRRRVETDALTRAATRQTLLRHIRQLLQRPEERPFCVAMMDLDHFKAVNDTHGHPVGDRVLVDVVRRIRSAMRDSDLLGRYGGEEFILLLRNTRLETAQRIAERIREHVAASPVRVGGRDIGMSVSIGLVQARKDDSVESLVDRADACLYEAKRQGRNRVVIEDDVAGN